MNMTVLHVNNKRHKPSCTCSAHPHRMISAINLSSLLHFQLVSVVEQVGLIHTGPEALKTGFLALLYRSDNWFNLCQHNKYIHIHARTRVRARMIIQDKFCL